jgi:hypothetical protein
MGFLLLGTDSLIACIAVGPIISRRIALPFCILFGVGDGGRGRAPPRHRLPLVGHRLLQHLHHHVRSDRTRRLLDRDRHLLEVGDGEGPGFHQSAVGRVDPAVGAERRQHHLSYWRLRCLCVLTPLPWHSRCWEKCA